MPTTVDVATIRVGLTEPHGMAKELCQHPADGVHYSFLRAVSGSRFRMIGSSINGYLDRYHADEVDLVEAVLSPIRTNSRWVYSLAHLAEACAFDAAGAPLPPALRLGYVRTLMSRPNFKKLIFWSHAGYDTLGSYGAIDAADLADKATVVYPAVRRIPDHLVRYQTGDLRLLFSGDFFRKGGAHVVDAFERARRRYPGTTLTVCSDERHDFNSPHPAVRTEYLTKLKTMPGIDYRGRIAREELMNEVYPTTDIFVMPTYVETFGMALLEAMAFGIPVISTNHFAIPEMIENGVSGLLIDTKHLNCDGWFRGYAARDIPSDCREYVTDAVFRQMCRLIESVELRRSIGGAALETARTKFSFERRNAAIVDIYRQALA
jgi:glycosyltransferase involved in cell wall biosynthesis